MRSSQNCIASIKFKSVAHDHGEFLKRASRRRGFVEAYKALALEYQFASLILRARKIELRVKRDPRK